MDNMQNMGMGLSKNVCKCHHHKAMPVLVIVFGLLFVAGNMTWVSWEFVNMVWPILVVIAGIKKLVMGMGMCKCC